jgi:hypothetical protein
MLDENTNTTKKNTKALLDASRDVGLKVNSEKIWYMFVSCHQNEGQNYNLLTDNRYFENVTMFRHLGKTATYQNCIQEEIKRRLNSGKASYHSDQNLLSLHLFCRNLGIKM